MNVLLLRQLQLRKSGSLQSFAEYKQTESLYGNQLSSVTSEGTLLEYETLELRIHPPNVQVDNETYDDVTVVTVDSANRPGTLVEVVQCLTELGLSIRKARISSDGGWFVDEFFVTETPMGKVVRQDKLESIQKVLHVSGGKEQLAEYSVFELAGMDRKGLLSSVLQLLMANGCTVLAAAAWTYHTRIAMVVSVMDRGKPIGEPAKLQRLTQLLFELMGARPNESLVMHEVVRGELHTERRLHHLLLLEELQSWEAQNPVLLPSPSPSPTGASATIIGSSSISSPFEIAAADSLSRPRTGSDPGTQRPGSDGLDPTEGDGSGLTSPSGVHLQAADSVAPSAHHSVAAVAQILQVPQGAATATNGPADATANGVQQRGSDGGAGPQLLIKPGEQPFKQQFGFGVAAPAGPMDGVQQAAPSPGTPTTSSPSPTRSFSCGGGVGHTGSSSPRMPAATATASIPHQQPLTQQQQLLLAQQASASSAQAQIQIQQQLSSRAASLALSDVAGPSTTGAIPNRQLSIASANPTGSAIWPVSTGSIAAPPTTGAASLSPAPTASLAAVHAGAGGSGNTSGSEQGVSILRPNVRIQHSAVQNYWLVTCSCKDRNKLFFDTVCTLADMNYDVYHAAIDSEGELASQLFYVRPRYGECIWDSKRAEKLRYMIEASVQRRSPRGLKLQAQALERGSLVELLQALSAKGFWLTKADVRTVQETGVYDLSIVDMKGEIPDHASMQRCCESVGGLMLQDGVELPQPAATVGRLLAHRPGSRFVFSFPDRGARRQAPPQPSPHAAGAGTWGIGGLHM